MTHFAARSSLRRLLLLGAAAAAVTASAAHAAPGDLTPLAPVGAAAKVSGDGQWAAYSAIGANGKRQIFVRELATGTVTPVTNGDLDSDTSSTANGLGLDISVDGRYVVFDSAATNLVPGLVDANNADDVFRWNRTTGAIELVSAGPAGGTVAGAARQPHVSGDGQLVAFQAVAKLTAIDPGANVPQVYVRDMAGASTSMVSVTPAGVAPNKFAERSDISADGRYVTFVSDATDLALEDVDPTRDVFRRDLLTGTTIAVTSGAQNADSPAVNGDGSRVVFETFEALDPADTDLQRDVYLRDIAAGTTRLASVRGSALDDANEARGRDVSADGTRVSFDNGGVYVRDLLTNALLTVSADPTATFSSINGGGTFAGFLLGTGPQVGQLAPGNDATAPALTFAAGRVSIGADSSGAAQVLVGGAPVRLDANGSAAVAASTNVEVWDGAGNRASATSPGEQAPPPPPPPAPPGKVVPMATKVKLALERVRVGKRNRMLVTVRFQLSSAATARLEVRTQATKRKPATVVRLGPKVARKAGARLLELSIAPKAGRYTARIALAGPGGATSQVIVRFRIS